jgi:hypothetical protein
MDCNIFWSFISLFYCVENEEIGLELQLMKIKAKTDPGDDNNAVNFVANPPSFNGIGTEYPRTSCRETCGLMIHQVRMLRERGNFRGNIWKYLHKTKGL